MDRRRKYLRKAARIIGLAAAVWWLIFGIIEGGDMGLGLLESLLHTAVPGLIILVSIAVCWKWNIIGGILLTIEALLALAILSTISNHCSQMGSVLVILTMSLPLLLSGILFILIRKRDIT